MMTNYLIFLLLLWVFVIYVYRLKFMTTFMVITDTIVYLLNDIDNGFVPDITVKVTIMLSYILLCLVMFWNIYHEDSI